METYVCKISWNDQCRITIPKELVRAASLLGSDYLVLSITRTSNIITMRRFVDEQTDKAKSKGRGNQSSK